METKMAIDMETGIIYRIPGTNISQYHSWTWIPEKGWF